MCKIALEIKYSAGAFDKLKIEAKAEYVIQIKKAQEELKNSLAECLEIFTQDFKDTRKKADEAIKITTASGSVELPAGTAEKKLDETEAETFVKALKVLDKKAYDKAVEVVTVYKIKKPILNALRKEEGDIKKLIDSTYSTEDLKPLVFNFDKEI